MLRTPFAPRNFLSDDESAAIEVCGYAAPLEVDGFEREYAAVRTGASLYDFSMLHKFDITGPRALDAVNAMVVRDLAPIRPGRIAYGPVVDDDGLMIDDSTCMVLSPEHIRVTGGASLPEAIDACLRDASGVAVDAFRERVFQLNVQGPRARELLAAVSPDDLSDVAFPYYTFRTSVRIGGVDCFVARMGFTGELGYELWGPVDAALDVWDLLVGAGAELGIDVCGAGGFTVLTVRTETGMVMGDGLDYDRTTSPWECLLGWTVSATKRDYRGCEALLAAKDRVSTTLVTVRLDTDPPGDASMSPLFIGDDEIGHLNLAVNSPLAGSTLAMSTVHGAHNEIGTRLTARFDDIEYPGEIVPTPLYDPERRRVRS